MSFHQLASSFHLNRIGVSRINHVEDVIEAVEAFHTYVSVVNIGDTCGVALMMCSSSALEVAPEQSWQAGRTQFQRAQR